MREEGKKEGTATGKVERGRGVVASLSGILQGFKVGGPDHEFLRELLPLTTP